MISLYQYYLVDIISFYLTTTNVLGIHSQLFNHVNKLIRFHKKSRRSLTNHVVVMAHKLHYSAAPQRVHSTQN